jgi:KUP system potassium uptake protein
VPRVSRGERVEIARVADEFWHVTVHFGFIEIPNLPAALACARERGCDIDLDQAIYFGARDEVVRSAKAPLLGRWRLMFFGFLYRNAIHTVDRFQLPTTQFVEIGRLLEL